MPQSLEAGLPLVILTDGYQIVFEARDSTGTAVANVKVSNAMLFAEIEGAIGLTGTTPPFKYVYQGAGGDQVTEAA